MRSRRDSLQREPGSGLVVAVLVLLIRIYQRTVSPWLGPVCRFDPSCSQYMVASLRTYGAIRGTYRGIRRLLRCHPWNSGGYDPP